MSGVNKMTKWAFLSITTCFVFISCAKISPDTARTKITAIQPIEVEHLVDKSLLNLSLPHKIVLSCQGTNATALIKTSEHNGQQIKVNNFELASDFTIQTDNYLCEILFNYPQGQFVKVRLNSQTIVSYSNNHPTLLLQQGSLLVYSSSQFYFLGVQTAHADIYPLAAVYFINEDKDDKKTTVGVLDGTVRITPLKPLATNWAQVTKNEVTTKETFTYSSNQAEAKSTRFKANIPQRGCRSSLHFSRGFFLGSMGDFIAILSNSIYASRFDLASFAQHPIITQFSPLILGRDKNLSHFIMRQNNGYLCEKSEQNYNENQNIAKTACRELKNQAACQGIELVDETVRVEYR